MVYQKKLSNTKLIAANQVIDLLTDRKLDRAQILIRKHFKADSELGLFFKAWIHQIKGDYSKAIKLFEQSLLKNPTNSETLIGLAGSYLELAQYDRAIECAEHANLIEANNPKILLTLATCLSRSDKKNKATQRKADQLLELAFSQACEPLKYNKTLITDILASWGGVLLNLNKIEQARLVLEKAKALDPFNVVASKNLVSVYANLNMLIEAVQNAQVVSMSDDTSLRIDTLYQEGMLELMRGNWARGWRLHEARLQSARYKYRSLVARSKINFSSVNESHRVLVFQEQGIGDLLNFVHLLPEVSKLGAKVDLMILPNSFLPINSEVPSPKTLIAHNFKDCVNQILVYGVDKIDTEQYDCIVPLMSLPQYLGIGWKSKFELSAFETPVSSAISADIGIFWKGSPHHDNDEQRSLPVKYVNQLIRDNPDKTFVSLQLDRDEGLEQQPNLTIDKEAIAGLDSLAATISNCKLIITVDSMVAHLAGSLKKPVWILQAFSPDWRWGLERKDSIWYSTSCNFRQPTLDGWDAVIGSVSNELKHSKI